MAPEPMRLTAHSFAVTCAVGVPKNPKNASAKRPLFVSPIFVASSIVSSSQGAR
jgi:hypothetical protein